MAGIDKKNILLFVAAMSLVTAIFVYTSHHVPSHYETCDKNAVTTLDMENCAGAERDRVNAKLEIVFKQLLTNSTPAGQIKLKEARRAWEKYRAKQCAFDMSGHEDGRIYTTFIVLCYANMTQDYSEVLERQLYCTEGDLSCGGQ